MKQHCIPDFKKSSTYQIDYTAHFNKTFVRKFHKMYMNSEISPDEFLILELLNCKPNISQISMGKCLFKGKAHIGKILNEMQEKGLITRSINKKNNAPINTVTSKGKKIFEHDADTVRKIIVPKMDEEFTQEEIDKFISYLKRFRKVANSIIDVKLK